MHIDRKSMAIHILRIENVGCHRVRNTSVNDPIVWYLLRTANI